VILFRFFRIPHSIHFYCRFHVWLTADVFVCRAVLGFIVSLYKVYVDLYFTYLEINPLGKLVVDLNIVVVRLIIFILLLLILMH